MSDGLGLSKYLSEVLQDWGLSRNAFPRNVYPPVHWPIPFFGNPATAIVATVGVNPSSGEFHADRNWDAIQSSVDWERRLKDYFKHSKPAHEWFKPWRAGLRLLGLSYEAGTAAHFDISYRPTKAMLRNRTTDPKEFRCMVERDVAWLFRLLPLCENLRLLLTFGPIVCADGSTEGLATFLRKQGARHGFSVMHNGAIAASAGEKSGRSFYIHEVTGPVEKGVESRVMKNLQAHCEELRRLL